MGDHRKPGLTGSSRPAPPPTVKRPDGAAARPGSDRVGQGEYLTRAVDAAHLVAAE